MCTGPGVTLIVNNDDVVTLGLFSGRMELSYRLWNLDDISVTVNTFWCGIGYISTICIVCCCNYCQWTSLMESGTHYIEIPDRIHTPAKGVLHLGTWWRHQMETFSALLALSAGNSPVTSEFPSQRSVTRSFDIFFDSAPEQTVE